MKRLLSLGALVGGITCIITSASAQPAPCIAGITEGMFCQDRHAKVIAARIVLPGPTSWDFESFSIPSGTIIETNGHELRLKTVDLRIQGQATIRAFDEKATPDPQPKESDGNDAPDFARGPNTGGRCQKCDARHGPKGGDGSGGKPGEPGSDASLMLVEVTRALEGQLRIKNRGGRGGRAGAGGDGAAGGDGEQGGRAKTGIVDCSSGPNYGGNGGPGGDGGRGGPGGSGGKGGTVLLRLPAASANAVEVHVEGGPGGDGGDPGKGGPGGLEGFGGRGDGLCQGKEGDRKGNIGAPGQPRNDQERQAMRGPKGPDGADGTVVRF